MRLPLGFGEPWIFADRTEAGRRLGERLLPYKEADPVVLAIPRGGVVVAVEVAEMLHAPLDVVIPRKIGAPANPELAVGAVAGPDRVVLNEALIGELGISREYIDAEVQKQVSEIDRRTRLYRGGRPPIPLEDRTALIIDDGLATGFTALAAVRHVKGKKPSKLVLAVPVAPEETCARLKPEVDELICLETPETFFAVGQFYAEFNQVSDDEVVNILERYRETFEA